MKLFLAKQLSTLCKARGLLRLQLLSVAQPARPGRWAAEITVTITRGQSGGYEIPDGSPG